MEIEDVDSFSWGLKVCYRYYFNIRSNVEAVILFQIVPFMSLQMNKWSKRDLEEQQIYHTSAVFARELVAWMLSQNHTNHILRTYNSHTSINFIIVKMKHISH